MLELNIFYERRMLYTSLKIKKILQQRTHLEIFLKKIV